MIWRCLRKDWSELTVEEMELREIEYAMEELQERKKVILNKSSKAHAISLINNSNKIKIVNTIEGQSIILY